MVSNENREIDALRQRYFAHVVFGNRRSTWLMDMGHVEKIEHRLLGQGRCSAAIRQPTEESHRTRGNVATELTYFAAHRLILS